ncbi:MAG: TldD/PmbA family protein [Pseudomonadota bacterium]
MRRRQFLYCAAAAAMPTAITACSGAMPPMSNQPRPGDQQLGRFELDSRGLERILGALGRNGADFGEVFIQRQHARRLRAFDGQLLSVRNGVDVGAGLRVVRNSATGFAVSESLREASLLSAARAASASSTAAEAQSPAPIVIGRAFDRYAVTRVWSEVPVLRRHEIVATLDSLLRQADAGVVATEITLTDVDDDILIARLDGRLVADRRPMTRLSAQVSIRESDVTHTGFVSLSGRQGDDWFSRERLQTLATDAIEKTRQLFDARKPPSGELPVILAAGSSGVVFHETLGHALEADRVSSGASPYHTLGETVASEVLTLVDDPTLPGARGSLNVDDEGEPAARRVLVEAGTLQSFVHDRASAQASGASAAGNGRRASFRHVPLPRLSNTTIENGQHEPDELLSAMDRGVIAESYTGGGVDSRTGRFRFRVRNGWFVEGGGRRVPVRDFDIAGDASALPRKVALVANDWKMDLGGWTSGKNGQAVPVSQGMPSLLVDSLDVQPLS